MLRVTIVYRDNSTAVQFDATEAMTNDPDIREVIINELP